ncbi:hypothetical protein PSI23_12585 [Xenorhabdus sp. XENO-10]|uniref:Uncharacterized protein n=1 Tax=Xenorhabdus yunnanensis TaxID=3025878 RepID=A0ABT5LHT7_9GAMM|nr:hypothetical protein [Xenorhabdus yunnanensis]MDC9590118.1 hypothetical protein [Xenorhabdus yunnanensis]
MLLTSIAMNASEGNSNRITVQIISGVGFLGDGVIIFSLTLTVVYFTSD